jgi:hypothetical protein
MHVQLVIAQCTVLLSTLVASTSISNKYTSLEKFCYKDGSKREVSIFQKAQMYVFNSSVTETFKCHLELEQRTRTAGGGGFSVYIQYMNLAQGVGCTQDFMQFGKDLLFITTSKSKKFCGRIPEPVKKFSHDNLPAGFERDDFAKERIHKEYGTDEMDIWIQIQPGLGKELVIVVTPHTVCTKGKKGSRPCPNSSECVSSELFCDGMVNCISNSLDEDSRFCPHLEAGGLTESAIIGIPLILIICVVIVVFFTFTFFAVKEGIKRMKVGLSRPAHVDQRPVGAGQTLLSSSASSPEAGLQLPPFPPTYDEAVGPYSQDPPKYSEIKSQDSVDSDV